MDKCGICLKPAVQLFETGKDGIYACFKCQPLVPEVTIGDESEKQSPPPVKEEETEPLFCDICDKSFSKSMQLQNHMRNHRAERRFICTYCNKAFSQSNNLRAHLRIHTNERPYKCKECGKAFTQVTNLNNHVRLHTGERPFVCTEPGCDKAYAQVTNLNQHRKRHMSGRSDSYDCSVCGERFAQRNQMYTHRRVAHDIKSPVRSQRHACNLCGVTLPTETHFQIHMAQHTRQDNEHKPVGTEWGVSCVFSTCGAKLSSARDHTDHLLQAHQLRVLARGKDTQPPKRGRPPKILTDPLEIPSIPQHRQFEVQIIKEEPPFLPKSNVQSLFE